MPANMPVDDPIIALKSAIMTVADELEKALETKLQAEHDLLKAQHMLDTERFVWETERQTAADTAKIELYQIAFGLREANPKATETHLAALLFVLPDAVRERQRAAEFDLKMHNQLYYKEGDLHTAKLDYYEACNAVEVARMKAKSLDLLVRLECSHPA